MNIAARDEALRMLRAAGMPELPTDVRLLHDDVLAVANDLNDEVDAFAIVRASRELERRIGGAGNLQPYLACLRAGAEVRA